MPTAARAWGILATTFLLGAASGAARAEPEPGAGTAPPASAPGPGAPPEGRTRFVETIEHLPTFEGPVLDLLEAAWSEVRTDLERSAWAEAAGRSRRLVEVARDLGLPNAEELSTVLLHAAARAAVEGEVDSAQDLAAAAAVVSPDLAGPRFEKARYAFQRSPFELTEQIRELRGGFERLSDDLPAGLAFLGNAVTAAIWVLFLLTAAFGLAMFVRHGRFAASDLRRLLPRGVTLAQSTLLLGAVLVAPFFAGFGILLTLVVWLVATSLFQRPAERVVSILLLIGIGALPVATSYVVRALHFPATPEAVLHRCGAGICNQRDQAVVRHWANTAVLPYESNFTLALALKRSAGAGADTFAEAVQFATVANDVEETAESLTLLGNLTYLQALRYCRAREAGQAEAIVDVERKQNEALDLWRRATEKSRSAMEAAYNSHIVLIQLGRTKDAEPFLERAMASDTDRVLTWNKEIAQENNLVQCRDLTRGNRHLMDPRLPTKRLADRVLSAKVPNDALVLPFGGLVTGRAGTAGLGLLGLAGAGIVVLLWTLVGLLRPSRPCLECASVAEPGTRLDIEGGAVCERCLLIDIRRAFVDAKEQWFREKEREAHLARRARRVRLVTWFLPGFGHLLRGAPIRGVVFLGLVLGSVVGAFALHAVVQDPSSTPGVSGGRLFAYGSVAAITWIVAVLDAHTGGTAA